jgi:hypothetical protein
MKVASLPSQNAPVLYIPGNRVLVVVKAVSARSGVAGCVGVLLEMKRRHRVPLTCRAACMHRAACNRVKEC